MITKTNRPWLILGVVYIAEAVFALVFQSIPPVLTMVRREFALSYTQAGLLMTLFASTGVVLVLPGGFLADRYGPRLVGAICFSLMISGTALVAVGRGFFWLGLGRFIAGSGGLVLPVIAGQLISRSFPKERRGVALGIQTTALPVGYVSSFIGLAWLGAGFGWRTAVIATTGAAVLALVVFLAGLTAASPTPVEPDQHLLPALSGTGRTIWWLGLTGLWYNAAVVAALTFLPDFLSTRHYTLTAAGFMSALLMIGAAVISPIVGLVVDRFRTKERLITIGSLGMAVSFALLPVADRALVPLMLVLSAAAAFIVVPMVALIADILPAKHLGLGFGILNTCFNAGVVVGPFLVGLARDLGGSYNYAFAVLAGFSLLALMQINYLSRRRQVVVVLVPAVGKGGV